MKRALLIAGGTVGGLGAVLAITPPQLNSSELALPSGATTTSAESNSGATSNVASTASSTATKKTGSAQKSQSTTVQKKSTKSSNSTSATSTQTSNSTAGNTATSNNAVPAQENSTATGTNTSKSAATSGDFTGSPINVGYGVVQVKISISNGKITDAVAVQAPSGRNDRWTNYALPILKQQTLAAQSDAISGASGASYTSYGWYKSLQSALTKAGML